MRLAQALQQTGSTPGQCPATPPWPGDTNPVDVHPTFWHRQGRRVGTLAHTRGICQRTPTTRQALGMEMPRRTTPAERQLCLGLEKHPKLQRQNRIMKCTSVLGEKGEKKKTPKPTPSYTQWQSMSRGSLSGASCPGVDRDHVTRSEICSPESVCAAFPASVSSDIPSIKGCWFKTNVYRHTQRHPCWVLAPGLLRGTHSLERRAVLVAPTQGTAELHSPFRKTKKWLTRNRAQNNPNYLLRTQAVSAESSSQREVGV